MNYLYIVALKNKQAFKIGKASDPKDRLYFLSKYYDFDFTNVLTIANNESKEIFRIESLLHSACSKNKILFEYEGGTEFFSYEVYDKVIETAKNIANLYGSKIEQTSLANPEPPLKSKDETEENKIINSLREKIKNRRLACNIKQEQLAKVTGLGVRTIQRIENGNNVNFRNIISVMKALDLDYLFANLEIEDNDRKRAS